MRLRRFRCREILFLFGYLIPSGTFSDPARYFFPVRFLRDFSRIRPSFHPCVPVYGMPPACVLARFLLFLLFLRFRRSSRIRPSFFRGADSPQGRPAAGHIFRICIHPRSVLCPCNTLRPVLFSVPPHLRCLPHPRTPPAFSPSSAPPAFPVPAPSAFRLLPAVCLRIIPVRSRIPPCPSAVSAPRHPPHISRIYPVHIPRVYSPRIFRMHPVSVPYVFRICPARRIYTPAYIPRIPHMPRRAGTPHAQKKIADGRTQGDYAPGTVIP